MKTQTAVDFLLEEVECRGIITKELKLAFKQAKEMEKQQIVHASGAGWSDGVLYSNGEQWTYESPEQYYQYIYGNGDIK